MSEENLRYVHVKMVNGQSYRFSMPPLVDDPSLLSDRIEQIIQRRILMVQVENRVLSIPFENIESFEVSPSPERLPSFIIKGEELLDP